MPDTNTTARLVDYLRAHGVQAWPSSKGIDVVDVWTKAGRTFSDVVTLPATATAVRTFLGY